MVKVTNPLGGTEAHGQIGKFVIFQGTTAKGYAAPVFVRTQTQTDAQDRFQSMNKVIRALGPWGRATMQSLFGRNWMAFTYQAMAPYWDELVLEYAALDVQVQDEWTLYAPVTVMTLDPGLIFYVCAWGLERAMYDNGYFVYDFWEVGELNAAGSREWWDKTLDGVFCGGKYDQENTDINYSGGGEQWLLVNDAEAYNGSYRESGGASPSTFLFWFFGTGFGLIYKQVDMLSTMHIETEEGFEWIVSQNDSDLYYQVEWRSPVLFKGLHRVIVRRTGADGTINIDGIMIYG